MPQYITEARSGDQVQMRGSSGRLGKEKVGTQGGGEKGKSVVRQPIGGPATWIRLLEDRQVRKGELPQNLSQSDRSRSDRD